MACRHGMRTNSPSQAKRTEYLREVRIARILAYMTLAPNERPRFRRTASRKADALLGERAHILIWRAGRTQGSVAEALGIEATAFGKKLKGKNGWALQEVLDLAAELDTSVAYLLGETEEPSGPGTPVDSPSAPSGQATLAQSAERFTRNEESNISYLTPPSRLPAVVPDAA